MKMFALFAIILVFRPCCSRFVPDEESVVSVYTTQPTTAGTNGLDVYQQIANNLAERITSPIYRFLGIRSNKTDNDTSTKKPWAKIELLDETPEEVTKSVHPVDNSIDTRDVEELSVEALKKIDRKPEKVTLYSSYLPVGEKLTNGTVNDDDDDLLGFDDGEMKSRDGPFITALEWIASMFQLVWGALEAIFRPGTKDN